MKAAKYWVWRGQAYSMSSWKTPCKECGEPTDYHLEDRQEVYLADDIEPLHEDLAKFLKQYIQDAQRWSFDLEKAQRLLTRLGVE